MTESTVSSPFMKRLREILPGAVVVKHHDSSLVGLPDCSVTWNKKIAWLEFKLWVPPQSWDPCCAIPFRRIAEASPVQYRMMQNLAAQATLAAYVIWVKKMRQVLFWNLGQDYTMVTSKTTEMANFLKGYLGGY